MYPSDDDLNSIAEVAHTEARELFALLGISPTQLANPSAAVPPQHQTLWVQETTTVKNGGDCGEDEEDEDEDKSSPSTTVQDSSMLQCLYEEERQNSVIRRYKTDQALKNLMYAAVTVSLMINWECEFVFQIRRAICRAKLKHQNV